MIERSGGHWKANDAEPWFGQVCWWRDYDAIMKHVFRFFKAQHVG